MKVFISQPMNGKSDEEILKERNKIIHLLKERHGEDVEILDSFFEDYVPSPSINEDRVGLKYLSKSLEILADADLVVFAPGYKEARGCLIEYECAKAYGIPIDFQMITEDEI